MKRMIFIVESDGPMAELLTRIFMKMGMEVVYANDAKTAYPAWEIIREEVCMIVSNTHAPKEFSGVELLNSVRKKDEKTPFYLMSGDDSIGEPILQAFRDLGMTEFLSKPFNSEYLSQLAGNVC